MGFIGIEIFRAILVGLVCVSTVTVGGMSAVVVASNMQEEQQTESTDTNNYILNNGVVLTDEDKIVEEENEETKDEPENEVVFVDVQEHIYDELDDSIVYVPSTEEDHYEVQETTDIIEVEDNSNYEPVEVDETTNEVDETTDEVEIEETTDEVEVDNSTDETESNTDTTDGENVDNGNEVIIDKTPVIEGTDTIDITQGSIIYDFSLKAVDYLGNDITENIVFSDDTDFKNDGTDLPGKYTLYAYVTDSEDNIGVKVVEVNVTRNLEVIEPITPEVPKFDYVPTFEGDYNYYSDELSIIDNLNMKVTDFEDGDITDQIELVKNDNNYKFGEKNDSGLYMLEYYVEDSAGNGITIPIKIFVSATPFVNMPVIKSVDNISYDKGIVIEPEYSAYDIEDGDLTDKVTVTYMDGFKNDGTDEPGTYYYVLDVYDSTGYRSTKTVMVYILDY